jgi:hypothetical protein
VQEYIMTDLQIYAIAAVAFLLVPVALAAGATLFMRGGGAV